MKRLIAGAAALTIVVAACGDDDDTSDALSSVCDREEQVIEDLSSLAALDPATATTGDYRSAVDALNSSIEDLQSARNGLVEQDVDNVQSAYDSLRSSLEGLDDVPLAEAPAEAASAVQAEVTELQEQYLTAYANSSCAPGDDE